MAGNRTRTFVAVPIPGAVRDDLGAFVAAIRPLLPPMKWVDKANYHVTLRFLGDLSAPQIEQTKRALESLAGEPAFAAELARVGGFPLRGRLRVLWAGFRQTDNFGQLAATTGSILAAAGLGQEDDDFHPHITVARARSPMQREKLTRIEAQKPATWGRIPVESVHLYASHLTPDGPRYQLLHQVHLGGVRVLP